MENERFFIPVDIEQRKQQRERLLNKIINKIQTGLNDLKTAKSTDPKEQTFINLFKDSIIQVDNNEHSDVIYFINKSNCQIAYYYLASNDFWYSHKNIWEVFENKFDMNYDEIKTFMTRQQEKYFKLDKTISYYGWI